MNSADDNVWWLIGDIIAEQDPAEIASYLHHHHVTVRETVLKHPLLPEAVIDQVIRNGDLSQHRLLANNPSLKSRQTRNLLSRLEECDGEHDMPYQVLPLLRNPNTPGDVLDCYLEKYGQQVVYCITANPQQTEASLRKLLQCHSAHAIEAIAQHPNATADLLCETLSHMSTHRWSRQHHCRNLLRHPAADVRLLEAVFKVADALTQSRVARHPLCPPVVLAAVIRRLRELPVEELRSLLGDQLDLNVAIAKHPNADEDILRDLADDHRSRVRLAVAGNRKTPDEVRILLAFDSDPAVAEKAAKRFAAGQRKSESAKRSKATT